MNGSSDVQEARARFEAMAKEACQELDSSIVASSLIVLLERAYQLGMTAGASSEMSLALAAQSKFLSDQEDERRNTNKRQERHTHAMETIAEAVVFLARKQGWDP